jgi:hypothetical protein
VFTRSTFAAVLFYAALAAVVLWPYRSARYRSASDLDAFIAGVVEARNALSEGQFPIRVAPRQLDGVGYPLFQFYANLPYTVSGAICAAGVSPFTAWKLAMLAAITAGGTFTYLTAYRLTRRRGGAEVVAGAAFVLAPYLMTDLNARGAVAEYFALQFLPIAMYATLRCLASARRRYVVACAVAWMLVGLTHNITYMYGVLFVGALTLTMLGRPRRAPKRVARLVAAGVLHAALMAWYIVPQLRLLPLLEMQEQTISPAGAGFLSTADILFSPVLRSPPGSSTPNLGLQVGWPILAGVMLAAFGLVVISRGRESRLLRRVTARMLVLFALAFVLAWSPMAVWDHVPRVFWFIQFPYRMLGYVTLFGALLAACGIALCRFDRTRGIRRANLVTTIALASIGAAAVSYFPRAKLADRSFLERTIAHPVCMGLNDYMLSGAAAARTGLAHPDVDLARPASGLLLPGALVEGEVRERANAALNIPEGATSLHLLGRTEAAGDGMRPDRIEGAIGATPYSVKLPAGTFDLHLPLDTAAGSAQAFSLESHDEVNRHMRVVLKSVRYDGALRPATRKLITAEEVLPDVRRGLNDRYRFDAAEAVLLQMPVLFYPGMMRVHDNGHSVPFANVGRYLALDLPAGRHSLSVRFAGVAWANAVTAVAWVVVGLSLVIISVKQWARRRRRPRPAAPVHAIGSAPTQLTFAQALAACLAIATGVAIALGGRAVRDRLAGHLLPPTAAASRNAAGYPSENAIDGRLDTDWHVDGLEPARLTVRLPAPRKLRGVRFHARQTALFEAWRQVNVACSLADWPALEKKFAMPDAARRDVTEIHFPKPIWIDRLDMQFFDAVLERPDGRRVEPQSVNPGYAEVELLDAK